MLWSWNVFASGSCAEEWFSVLPVQVKCVKALEVVQGHAGKWLKCCLWKATEILSILLEKIEAITFRIVLIKIWDGVKHVLVKVKVVKDADPGGHSIARAWWISANPWAVPPAWASSMTMMVGTRSPPESTGINHTASQVRSTWQPLWTDRHPPWWDAVGLTDIVSGVIFP
jgi:hypothetical protein